jgi:N,N'-diacetyllegionaminate synthase
MACYVIAEAGVNHNGSDSLALELVDAAAAAGADAVKFQTFRAEKLVMAGAAKAEYQVKQTGSGDQLSMLRALELSEEAHRAILRRCAERGIEFLSTPFDEESAVFLVGLGMARIKVPSGELTNRPFIEYLAGFDLPLIVSTGMATLEEVHEAVDWIAAARVARGFASPLADRLILLHCTSNYPTAAEDVNLRAMATLAQFSGLPVGYSDHTPGIAVTTAAVALGAIVVEKHFTLDRNLPGPDHQASLEPDELAAMVSAVRIVEAAMGDGVKAPRPKELAVRDVARRSIVLARDLAAGQVLQSGDLSLLRPGTGIPPKFVGEIVGRQASRDLVAGTLLAWEDFA